MAKKVVRLILSVLGLVIGGAALAPAQDCQLDACVRCEIKANGKWVCKIVFSKAHCDCDAEGGGSCSQSRDCKVIV